MESVRQEWSSHYDRVEMQEYIFPKITRQLRAGARNCGSFLEAGCGCGDVCFDLANSGMHMVGVDIARNAIEQARQSNKRLQDATEFLVADITYLPFQDHCFEGLSSLGVIEHFRNTNEVTMAFSEAKRVLTKSGFFFCTVPNVFVPIKNASELFLSKGTIGLYHRIYTVSYLRSLGSSVGFELQAEILDVWVPFFLLFDGLLKKLRVRPQLRLRFYRMAVKLPEPAVLRLIGGHIVLSTLFSHFGSKLTEVN